jgi:UDPglucose 6-dehydrogenase
MYATVLDADAIFHVTEWKEFRMPNWQVIKRLIKLDAVLIDGRNVFDKNELEGINYLRIG